jgi:hypothetical protein
MEALVMKIHEDRVHAPKNPMNCTVVQVQEAKGPAVTGFAFDFGHVQHV